MIDGLDSSSDRPTALQVAQARAAGVGLWGGYLATRPGVLLASPWDLASFDLVRPLAPPLAFCSGWDDPAACRALAGLWRVRLCLDVEPEIRGDGPWVQPWLDASQAGLYGNAGVHVGRRAPFHVFADYPGFDPRATWPSWEPRPPTPTGWQWLGSHAEFGLQVDRGRYDDWFATAPLPGGFEMDYSLKLALVGLMYFAVLGRGPASQPEADQWAAQIGDQGEGAWEVLQAIHQSAEGQAYDSPAGHLAALDAAVSALRTLAQAGLPDSALRAYLRAGPQ